MDKTTTFKVGFDPKRCRDFINQLCNGLNESKKQTMQFGVPFGLSLNN